MKIGIVCFPSIGGSGVLATELGRHLACMGMEIHFIAYSQPFRLQFHENIIYHQVMLPPYEVFPYPPYDLALLSKIAEVIDREQLDVIHAHYAVPHAVVANMARQMAEHKQVALITTLHGTDITLMGKEASFFRLIAHAMKESDGLTAVSQDLARDTQNLFQLSHSPRCIYNFVDTEEYRPQKGATHPCKNRYPCAGKKVLMHISNFRQVKRVDHVITIFHQVNREIPSCLFLIGDGPCRGEVQEMVQTLGLEERVFFLGAQDTVIPLLSLADVLVQPSEKEAFGLVNIEAMACEVPVVASAVGGVPEVVTHGKTGFLSPPGDVAGMARDVLRILKEPNLQWAMGRAARERVCTHFSSQVIIPQYVQYYEEVLQARRDVSSEP